jgi:hypothetical protein
MEVSIPPGFQILLQFSPNGNFDDIGYMGQDSFENAWYYKLSDVD